MHTTRTQRAICALVSVVVTIGWLFVSVIGPAYLDSAAAQVATATPTSLA